MAAWRAPRPAPCSRRPRRLLAHAARARASRQRAPQAAAHEHRLRPLLRPCAGAIGCSHATGSVGVANRARARVDNSTVLAFGRTEDSTHTHWCGALVRQRLGGVGGSAPVHAQRTPAQQAANRPSPREDDACGVGGAIDGAVCKGRSQINTHSHKNHKQTNKQPTTKSKQRRTEQRVGCGSCEQICAGTAKQTRCSMRATSAHLRRCGVP